MAFYIITYYFPTGMFVIVSWISFLVPPESVPGRMTILVTVFLCLVNIFNSITNDIPKANGLTAIETFIIICIMFVFGALMGKNIKRPSTPQDWTGLTRYPACRPTVRY